MPDNGSAGEVFLAELTPMLTDHGWIRDDRNYFAMAASEFTHPDTAAVLTITGTAWNIPSAYLSHDGPDAFWRVACDNPHPAALAAAISATLACSSTSPDHGGDLKALLKSACWTNEQGPGNTDEIRESQWTSPDGHKTVCFPDNRFSTPTWLICKAETAAGITLGHYTATRATPLAVLAAFALTLTPSTDGVQTDVPDTSA